MDQYAPGVQTARTINKFIVLKIRTCLLLIYRFVLVYPYMKRVHSPIDDMNKTASETVSAIRILC